jgi:hypothetical protein
MMGQIRWSEARKGDEGVAMPDDLPAAVRGLFALRRAGDLPVPPKRFNGRRSLE